MFNLSVGQHDMKSIDISLNKFLNIPILAVLALAGCTGAEDSGGGGNTNKTTGTSACLQDPEALGLIQQLALADAAQGGQLYDEWWVAAGGTEPAGDHPLWDQQTTNTRSGLDTWRCKECHGWDYKGDAGSYGDTASSHYTGFPGIMAATAKDPIDVFCTIRSGTADYPDHNFSQQLSGVQILHLTKFIIASQNELASEPMPKGVIDTSSLVNNGVSQGNATNGGTLYTDGGIGCGSSNCHGPTGTAQHEPLGTLANENPWEMIHKIRFGHPGAIMPAYTANLSNSLTLNETNDIVAFAQQSLDDPGAGGGTLPPPSDISIVVRGGRLYDNWMSESGSTSTVINDDNPLWARQVSNTRTGPDTWRCKECHGWDYKGADGAYGVNSDHYTGFGGIWNTQFDNVQDLVNFLTDGFPMPILGGTTTAHNFGGLMNAEDINALANFVLYVRGTDIGDYIKSLGIILTADYTHGQELYNSKPFGIANGNCELCHGLDGKLQVPVIVGAVANENPWETLHKIRFGQPNSRMPSMEEAGFNVQDATDVVFFAQTLPIQ